MTQVSIIVPVAEEHDGTPYGQYVRHLTLPRVPGPGEWVSIASKATVAQNVLWHIGKEQFERVEVFLTQRPLGHGFPETINELFDDGFVPMRPDGTEMTWEQDAEERANPMPEMEPDEVADEPLDTAALGEVIESMATTATAPDFHDETPEA